MRFTLVMLLAVAVLAVSCKSGGTPGVSTRIELRRTDGTVLSSNAVGTGSIQIGVLEQYDIDVFLIEERSGQTHEFEVTAETDFNFSATNVAGATSEGLITGLEAGTTLMVAQYRHPDPTATDKIDLDIIVN